MIHVETLPLGPLETNCYLVYREGSNAWPSIPAQRERALQRSSAGPICIWQPLP